MSIITSRPHFIALCYFLLLCFEHIVCFFFFFCKLNVCGNPALTKSVGVIFFNSICSLHISVSCFGNSHNIAGFFFIVILVMVISDLCCSPWNCLRATGTAHMTASLVKVCVLTAPWICSSSVPLPLPQPPCSLRHNNIPGLKQSYSSGASGKESACWCRRRETRVQSLGWEDPLEKEMAIPSSILDCRIPWTEESGEFFTTMPPIFAILMIQHKYLKGIF